MLIRIVVVVATKRALPLWQMAFFDMAFPFVPGAKEMRRRRAVHCNTCVRAQVLADMFSCHAGVLAKHSSHGRYV